MPLLKKPDDFQPSNTRPITILSLLYRLWGRVVTQVILQEWNTFFPKSITGFLPGRSAVIPMYQLQVMIERSHLDVTQTWSGLTLDIKKCFNCLPVPPVAGLLERLGVPPEVISFWAANHANLDRCWQIANQLFPTGPQNTGVPEGDSLSVIIMLAFNYIWTHAIAEIPCLANAYADNWAYATADVNNHAQILPTLLDLIQAMRLEVDWVKTWIWVSHDPLKAQLRSLLSAILPPDVTVECLPHAKDSGFILHYRRKQMRKPQKERHAKALATLRKLQRSHLDRETKALISQTAVVKSLYGGHTHVTGEVFFRELRTEIARALVGPHNNVNPFLVCMTLSNKVLDPELYMIRQALRFAREYLQYASPDETQAFLDFATDRQHRIKQVTGPCGALVIYLEKVDWTLTKDGTLQVSAFYNLHILQSPRSEIVAALEHAWMEHVAIQLTSRKGYGAIPVIDRPATISVFQALPEAQQKTAAYAITGGYMLQHQKGKFDDTRHDLCDYCETELDNQEHRVLRCPTTEPVRVQFPDTCAYLDEYDPIHVICPVVYVDPTWELHRQIWTHMPEPILHLTSEAVSGTIFTDGTCQIPHDRRYRYAANAAVCFRPDAPADATLRALAPEDLLDAPFHVIACAMIPGQQSIARAELLIVVKLVEACVKGPIVTDSQYVILVHHKIQQTPDVRQLHMCPQFDLLRRWHAMYWLHNSRPDIQKVKSHLSLTDSCSPEELHMRIGNAAADAAADQAIQHLAQEQIKDLLTLHKEQSRHRDILVSQFQMRFEMGLLCLQLDKPEVALHGGGDPTVVLQRFKDWDVTEHSTTFQTDDIPAEVAMASRSFAVAGVTYLGQS